MGSRRECTWILGLSGFRVVSLEQADETAEGRLWLHVERRGIRRYRCGGCGRRTSRVRAARPRTWDDLPWAQHPVTLVYQQRRVICRHFTLKQNSLKRSDLDEFVDCYKPGARHDREETWSEENEGGRWRAFDYEELAKRDKLNLDIFWLKDESLEDSENLPEPDVLAAEIVEDLQAALEACALDPESAEQAIRGPIRQAGVDIKEDALRMIVERTEGYPYFLQEWGSHAWDCAPSSPVRKNDVDAATEKAVAALDKSFFRVRFDRLTPREQEYLRAMAELGAGPHRSGDVAATLGIPVTTAGPLRTGLIRKGMVWSPTHGDTAFTVPMFHDYMLRAMPNWTFPRRG